MSQSFRDSGRNRGFTLIPDHEPLIGFLKKKDFATTRQEKMVVELCEYCLDKYNPGKLMIFPDAF
jgi:hypothetical protein